MKRIFYLFLLLILVTSCSTDSTSFEEGSVPFEVIQKAEYAFERDTTLSSVLVESSIYTYSVNKDMTITNRFEHNQTGLAAVFFIFGAVLMFILLFIFEQSS